MAAKLRFCPHCGSVLTKPRSAKAHRMFFGVIEKAFDSWPEDHHFQPDDKDHLRAWLQVKAGHRDLMTSGSGEKEVDFLIRVVKKTRETGYAFPIEFRGAIAVGFPRSINWDTLSQQEFSPIAESVYAIIEDALKLPIKEMQNADNKNLSD